jgi:hypothetical protein
MGLESQCIWRQGFLYKIRIVENMLDTVRPDYLDRSQQLNKITIHADGYAVDKLQLILSPRRRRRKRIVR